jgi:mRNA interferase RelE/StbE
MPYDIQTEKSALKALKKLPNNVIKTIWKEIGILRHNPRPPGCKKLKGQDNLFRIRAGDYRIVYQVQDKVLIVLIIRIGDRKEIYRDF